MKLCAQQSDEPDRMERKTFNNILSTYVTREIIYSMIQTVFLQLFVSYHLIEYCNLIYNVKKKIYPRKLTPLNINEHTVYQMIVR